MSVRRPSGRPSNMGQENSTLAQQSINISAGVPRATSTHGMQSPNTAISNATNHHHAYFTPRSRSRSPGNGPPSRFPLPQKQRLQSLDTRMRSRSPPLHSTGRFPSPGNVRNKFVREDVRERRNTYDARNKEQRSSPRSPDAGFGTRHNAAYRRSPEWRNHSDNYQNWARNAGSPNTPREPLAQRVNVLTADRGRGVAACTIDYHGLRDVPTGPRPKKRDSVARSPPRPERRDFITRSPCLFISFRHLPNLPKLTKHLRGMLGRDRMPGFIDIDDYGWNLVYEDSPAGLEKLTRCFEKYNNELLFSQYKLTMQCYPNGKQPRPQQEIDAHSSGGPSGSSAVDVPGERFDRSVVPRLAGFTGRQLTYPESTKSLESKLGAVPPNPEKADALARTPSHAVPDNLFSHSSDMLRTNEVPHMGTNTSLQSLRSDRDETGSLGSGVTRSDSSRVKRNKCYRCRGEAVPGSSILVRCSTCPRQYHRRCHQDFPIPADLTETFAWSCASCVKKGQASKEVPKEENQSFSSKFGKAMAESLPREAPYQSQTEMLDDCGPIAVKANEAMIVDEMMNAEEVSNEQHQLLRSDSKSPQHENQPQDDLTTSAKLVTVDEHAPLSDAEDLVAKSFAAAEVHSHSKPRSQKPGKLKITRTKLPPKPPSTKIQQSQGENQSDQNGGFVAGLPAATLSDAGTKAANMSEVVTRNSVADLRAIAHERHQTAIKNGADGHFANEEQRLHHNAPENTPRPSPAHQSPSEKGAPQKPSTMLPDSFAPAAAKHATEREIPESPDEVRRGEASNKDPIINPGVQALLQPTEIAFVPPPRRTSNLISAQDENSPALTRPRPRAPLAVAKCHNCQKPIPKGPTGKNKLCSGCKRDAAAAAGSNVPVDAKVAPQTSNTPLQTSFAPVANMGHSPQTIAASVELGPQGEDVIENTDREQVPSVVDDGKGRIACDTCRKHHKRCTHNNFIAQVSTTIETNEQGDDTVCPDKPTRETTDGAEDDSLASQADDSASDQGLVQSPLVAEILGELQFVPTVQTLLRGKPSMEVGKIRQLLKILDYSVTARTDMALLQRLIFIHDKVGDSGDRPDGSRVKLVAMALGSTAANRMQAKDVMDWIANTVPMYKKGEGNWASRISAMLIQGRLLKLKSGGYSGYWREDEWQEGDGGKPKAKWYSLLSEKMDEMWTWCPVLKKPLPPSESRKTGKSAAQRATAAAPASTVASTSGPVTPMSKTNTAVNIYCGSSVQDGKRLSAASAEASGDDAMDIDGIFKDPPPSAPGLKRKHHSRLNETSPCTPEAKDASSSDDEPLSAIQKRRRVGTLSQDRTDIPTIRQSVPTNKDVEDRMDLEPGMNTAIPANSGDRIDGDLDSASRASGTSGVRKKSRLVTLYLNGSRRSSNAEASDLYLPTKREQLATSLYNEWPEFRQHTSDDYDKLAEIQKRPRKKQLFGKLASPPRVRFGNDSSAQPAIPFNFSPEKRSRTRMVDPRPDEPYPWENPDNDPTRKEYTSLEELFDFPDNMIPIVSEGQLAYRDGTRTDDGRLPRAREIFKL